MAQQNQKQKQLITEVMQADEKDGLYQPTISKTETVKTMAQQTAVEWLNEQLQDKMYIQYGYGTGIRKLVIPIDDYMEFIKQAKQMEKEQIINAFENGIVAYDDPDRINDNINFDAENYYNETYGSNNQI